ncbi:MAG: DNA-directed RNA polymerase subunit alpha [Chloroflexi bacterium]|nr:DNA-directed RNA polymerase subunit alpha [Chloroflexota bacterium]
MTENTPIVPRIDISAGTKNYARFLIGPMESGFGTTLGNTLRRVLLSSLPGAAVTSVKINSVHHEFSPIPYAHEDTTRLILNVKQLRVKSFADHAVRLLLTARGEGEVTAADIECPPDVEIINPEQHLLTLDSPEADLEMELVVARGRGYSPAEERGRLPIGEIPVDAIFSPIRKVAFHVERALVGQMTDYDNLILEIWTDGTISPQEALIEAAKILQRHVSLVANFGGTDVKDGGEIGSGISSQYTDMLIEDLELSVRAYNCLKRAGISKVGQILERLRRGDEEMLVIRNFGQKSLDELKVSLHTKGIPLPGEDSEVGE